MTIQQTTTETLQNRRIHRSMFNNGIVLLAVENPAADIVAARVYIRAGGRYEPLSEAGLSNLLASVITKGTQRLSSQQIAEQVEAVGAGMGADASADYCLMSLKTVSADFGQMLRLLAEIMRTPAFPAAEVELERKLTLQGIRSMQEQPFSVANAQLRQILYGQHPYGTSSLGTEETVAQLSPAALHRYHQTYFRPDNLVISIVGRIDPTAAASLVDQCFGDWQNPQAELPALNLPAVTVHPQSAITLQDTQQAIVMLGYLAAAVQESDHIPLKLLNTYLGSGLSSRLFVELREKRGLAYDVSAFYPTRIDTSHFVTYIGTAPENTATAMEGLHHEVQRLHETLLTPEELQSAKNKLLGQYALGKQTNGQIAQIFGWYEMLNLGVLYDEQFQQQVAEVTAADIQQAVQRHLTRPYLSLVGPESAVNLAEDVANRLVEGNTLAAVG
ncbi:MAG: insulinase family protein [Pegethrix bostrychoides GSE-TBD4-15B]|jgi:predicted Zn-dependent peptidase|uniref:Insulinase family protein n=1 Tax=Pegethrix bostrychoides GSE-TBD4-15B TaxID=2839662 RepID=A0A951P6Y8_9CYAN|nr:insulinase family protein [Pegethrix bostrychoides GSE-TBD4-15B]